MYASLQRLAALPETTRVCCAHEYTLANLRFAAVVEPDNADRIAYQGRCEAKRAAGEPTLPSTIGLERAVNPFLRVHTPTVAAAIAQHYGYCPADPVERFRLLASMEGRLSRLNPVQEEAQGGAGEAGLMASASQMTTRFLPAFFAS